MTFRGETTIIRQNTNGCAGRRNSEMKERGGIEKKEKEEKKVKPDESLVDRNVLND